MVSCLLFIKNSQWRQSYLVDFDVKLDTDYAKWNMTKPSVNSLEYADGVITLVRANQRFVARSVDGLIKIQPAGLTQKK